jgi:transcriptional regulator with XRE-family HTH domain
MGLAKTEAELQDRISRFIKAELKRAGLTYSQLAERLGKHGLKGETENSVKAKLSRGSFAATFLLATIAALEKEGIKLADI